MRITMTLTSEGTRPMPGTDNPLMNAYSVTLSNTRTAERLTLPYYTGLGWTTDPTLGDVLETLASDLRIDVENADDMGLSVRAWEALRRQNEDVRRFFGDSLDALTDDYGDAQEWSEIVTGNEVTL